MDEIDASEVPLVEFGTQYAVFYPPTGYGVPSYLEGGYTLPDAKDVALQEADAYVVRITVERYDG